MADDSTVTIRANFDTREAVDLAIEHPVQRLGISRPDIFVQPAAAANTSGSEALRGDASYDGSTRDEAPLAGVVEIFNEYRSQPATQGQSN